MNTGRGEPDNEGPDAEMAGAQITIRRANAGDFGAIADLVNRAFDVERFYLEESETANSVAATVRGGAVYFVAVDSKVLVGCVNVQPRLKAIFQLAVESSPRREGIGRKLMAEAEKYA